MVTTTFVTWTLTTTFKVPARIWRLPRAVHPGRDQVVRGWQRITQQNGRPRHWLSPNNNGEHKATCLNGGLSSVSSSSLPPTLISSRPTKLWPRCSKSRNVSSKSVHAIRVGILKWYILLLYHVASLPAPYTRHTMCDRSKWQTKLCSMSTSIISPLL